jgi:dCTP deaminase
VAFWSGEKLAARLPTLLGPDYNAAAVKSARYTLRIGAEAYVTASTAAGGPRKGVIFKLQPNESFRIPPGQFAFLLTEENISVPHDALALISIKTQMKFQGLVNVSGFHVDPGWKGHLKFGIYNAGASDVHLRRGQDMFLIWYADLDRVSSKTYNNTPAKSAPHIPSEYANGMAGQMYSPQVLAGLIRKLERRMYATWILATAIAAAVVLIAATDLLDRKRAPQPIAVTPQIYLQSPPQAAAAPDISQPTSGESSSAAGSSVGRGSVPEKRATTKSPNAQTTGPSTN